MEAEVRRLTDTIKEYFNDMLLGYNFFIQLKRETEDWESDYDGSKINDKSVIRIIRKAKSVAQVRFHLAYCYENVCI